ncbi:hypothetical protein NM688_g1041 [Phlebia brevispora]|uniref:Uncharacterized protein n=1 Tax=Phlebia brevispora TaxID=194682 RepID=A0ACC1TCH7_9APHY|nr:hypothetical protein NM688_g1041 [Phlebia brevispora]
MSPDEEYKLLPSSPVHDLEEPQVRPRQRFSTNIVLRWLLAAQSLMTLALLIAWLRARQPSPHICSQLLYSPAQDAIVYETKKWTMAQNESLAMYSGDPSDEVDKAWDELYADFGLSQLSEEEALYLPNKTIAFPEDPDKYVVILSVFHQLHCVNVLRKVYIATIMQIQPQVILEKFYAKTSQIMWLIAWMFCVRALPIVFDWNDNVQKPIPLMSVAHTCRKWENIADWAEAHKM